MCRDVTKAYLQGEKPPRSILYKPPKEFFELFPEHTGKVFDSNVLFYVEVEAGLGWYRTFIPWLKDNILGYEISSIDLATARIEISLSGNRSLYR